MKFCLFVLFAFIGLSAVQCQINNKKLGARRAARQCTRENKIKYEVAMKFSKGEFADESQEAKCFLKCFAYKLKFFNTAGEFQKEELLDYTQFIAKDGIPAKELVDQCMETVQKGEDECDYAFQSYKCFWDGIKNAPEETAKDISGRFPIYNVLGFDHLNDEEEEVAEEKNVE